jgi:hypothetical protein
MPTMSGEAGVRVVARATTCDDATVIGKVFARFELTARRLWAAIAAGTP